MEMISLWNEFPKAIYGLGDVAEDLHQDLPMFGSPILKEAGTSLSLVMEGQIGACVTALYYWRDRYPDLGALTGIPFGLDPVSMYSWSWTQGLEIVMDLEAKYMVKIIPLYFSASQMAGWYKGLPVAFGSRTMTTPRPFQGLRMRATGYPAMIMQGLGAEVDTQSLDIPALKAQVQDGAINGIEWVDAISDLEAGWPSILPIGLVPGWHERCSVGHLVIHGPTWSKIQDKNRIIEWAQAYGSLTLAQGLADQGRAYRALMPHIHRIPDWILKLLEEQWHRLQAKIYDAEFHRIVDSMESFASDIDTYNSIQG